MAKKYSNPKDVDEKLIMEIVDSSPDYTAPGMLKKIQGAKQENTSNFSSDSSVGIDYKKIFFSHKKMVERRTFHLNPETKLKLETVLQRLGDGQISLFGYVDNILIHHLQTYKETINDLSKNHSDII